MKNFFKNIVKAFERSSAERAIKELEQMSDRDLNDIGLSRGEIREAVYQSIR
jgi:uncharacterized protein YjiS (DUF1127 family)